MVAEQVSPTPSLIVTLPVGVPGPDAGATVKSTMTGCPTKEGLGRCEAIVVMVSALLTMTESELQALSASFNSGTLLVGSTEQEPALRGLVKVATALGVASKVTSNEPDVPIVTGPVAEQVRVLLVIPQLILPILVMLVPFPAAGVP